jgi:hypothetical protein
MASSTIKVRNLKKIENANEALRILRRVAKGKTQHQVGTFRYMVNDRPSCLVGHALKELGVSREVLRRADNGKLPRPAEQLCQRIGLPESVAYVFGQAQNAQDNGLKWGKAIREAKDKAIEAGYLS